METKLYLVTLIILRIKWTGMEEIEHSKNIERILNFIKVFHLFEIFKIILFPKKYLNGVDTVKEFMMYW